MPVVSNTSPILNLAIIGELSLLREQFGEILIPGAVLEELRVEENLPGSQSVRNGIKAGWIRIERVKQDPLAIAMQRDLDKGEAEAIAPAMRVNAGWVLMDERDGRLRSLKEAMDRLREKAGFYVREDIYSAILQEWQEER